MHIYMYIFHLLHLSCSVYKQRHYVKSLQKRMQSWTNYQKIGLWHPQASSKHYPQQAQFEINSFQCLEANWQAHLQKSSSVQNLRSPLPSYLFSIITTHLNTKSNRNFCSNFYVVSEILNNSPNHFRIITAGIPWTTRKPKLKTSTSSNQVIKTIPEDLQEYSY